MESCNRLRAFRRRSSSAFDVLLLLISFIVTQNFSAKSVYADVLTTPVVDPDIDIATTDIETLLNMRITTASKASDSLQRTPAAVYVLTNEAIRRSGATSIPEALRYVPGVQVARTASNKWSVSIRGFNSGGSNKLLVMIDGRSIYDPLFSSVFWESKDVMLEDVERIEVIRGPGGSTWGANAVNGVINIITKNAKDTQGGLLSGGGGTEEKLLGSFRYGGKISEESHYRVFGKHNTRDEGHLDEGASDDAAQGRGGFRVDGGNEDAGNYMLQGEYYNGEYDGAMPTGDIDGQGGHFLGRWNKELSSESEVTAQAFYDNFDLDALVLGENREIGDVELHYQYQPTDTYRLITGVNYRHTNDFIRGSPSAALKPESRSDNLGGFFFDNKLELSETVELSFGSKYEYNNYTGSEVQPSAGLSWTFEDSHTLWTSVSRAVRTPSRLEEDLFVPLPNGQTAVGNRSMDSETLIAYEVGYRGQVTDKLFAAVTGFYNDYDELLTLEGGITPGNGATGEGTGGEAWLRWSALENLSFTGSYSYIDLDAELKPGSTADPVATIDSIQGATPRTQASLWASLNLGGGVEIDLGVRYVDKLQAPSVSSYTVADVRLGYKPSEDLELAVVGQNLFEDHHFEGGLGSSQVEQGVYGLATWRFGTP